MTHDTGETALSQDDDPCEDCTSDTTASSEIAADEAVDYGSDHVLDPWELDLLDPDLAYHGPGAEHAVYTPYCEPADANAFFSTCDAPLGGYFLPDLSSSDESGAEEAGQTPSPCDLNPNAPCFVPRETGVLSPRLGAQHPVRKPAVLTKPAMPAALPLLPPKLPKPAPRAINEHRTFFAEHVALPSVAALEQRCSRVEDKFDSISEEIELLRSLLAQAPRAEETAA